MGTEGTQPALCTMGTPSKGMHNSALRQVLLWNWGLSKLFSSCAVRSRLLLLPCKTHSTPTTTSQILAASRGHRGLLSPQKPETRAWGRQCLAAVQLLGRHSCELVPWSCNASKGQAASWRFGAPLCEHPNFASREIGQPGYTHVGKFRPKNFRVVSPRLFEYLMIHC